MKGDYEERTNNNIMYNRMYGFGDGKYYSEHMGNPMIYAKIGGLFPS